ncbi:HEAT repeat domain-containing protein [Halogeometricum limi]|uniref:HEAT repeat n=1 Tax=Halogeometricum limi TaxID=555875 RepID=A0A1I6FQN0_9EURY|nr:HEAT repeat domain-containing protein [Halogeometricum limi]SFR32226.1 HEAT repeat [Halogeometricum limi]
MSNQAGAADARIEVGYDAAVYRHLRSGDPNPPAAVSVVTDDRELARGHDGLRWHCEQLVRALEPLSNDDPATVEFYDEDSRYHLFPDGDVIRFEFETNERAVPTDGVDPSAGVVVDRERFVTELLRTAETFCDAVVGANPGLAGEVAEIRERTGRARVVAAGFGDWGLPVRLLDTVPETAHDGTVYTQTTVFATGDARFGAFDGDTLADDCPRDAPAAARIWLHRPELVDCGDQVDLQIVPNPDALVWRDHTFAGEVVDVSPISESARTPSDHSPDRRALLHVGAGTVAFDPDDVDGVSDATSSGDIAVGDRLRLRAARVHLSDVVVTDAPSMADRSEEQLEAALANPTFRSAAATELARRGVDAVDAIADCLRAAPPVSDRRALVHALDVLADEAAVPALVECLNDVDPDVRRAAAVALATVGDPGTMDALLAAVRAESDAATRRAIARAARDVDPTNALEHFASLVRTDTDSAVRESVVRVLSGTQSVHAEALVVEAVDDPDPAVACEAIAAVRWFTDERPVGGLLRRLMDDDPTVRVAAADAFVELGARASHYHDGDELGPATRTRVVRALLDRLHDENRAVRATVMEALGSQAHPESVSPLCTAYEDDEACRQSAVAALGRIGDLRAIPTVVAALDDDEAGVRRRACRACARLDTSAGVRRLCDLARTDPELAVRVEAVEALGHVGDDRDEVFETLEAVLGVDGQSGDARTKQRVSDAESDDADLRWEAVTALGRLDHPRARFVLRQVAEDDPDESVRDRARSRLD